MSGKQSGIQQLTRRTFIKAVGATGVTVYVLWSSPAWLGPRVALAADLSTLNAAQAKQMLAMARALCLEPDVLLLDEPTEGLMPSMIARIREAVAALRSHGVSTILVEQRVDAVLPVADRVLFVENGRSRETVDVEALHADPGLVHRYVGVG